MQSVFTLCHINLKYFPICWPFNFILVYRSHKYVFVQASDILYMAIAVVAVFWNAFPSLLLFITFKSHARKFFLIYFLYENPRNIVFTIKCRK